MTKPTGPLIVPRGVITKLIMANMEPIKAKKMASRTPMSVTSHSLKFTSSFGACADVGTPAPSLTLKKA